MKRLFCYSPENPRREDVLAFMCQFIREASQKVEIRICEARRTTEQNDRMWAMLTDVSEQVAWPVDGMMQHLSPEDWKHVLTAGLKREQRVAQGVEGGFVILGQRTSQMSKKELSDLMELIAAFGAEHGVRWTEPKRKAA